jgi:hypothetical protein
VKACLALLAALVFMLPAALFAEPAVPGGNSDAPIVISAQAANRWQQGDEEVWLLRGDGRLLQGNDVVVFREAVFWIDHAAGGSHQRSKVVAYMEGNVGMRLVRGDAPIDFNFQDQKWFGRFFTSRGVQVSAGVVAGKPDVLPGIYQRGMNARNPENADALRQTRVEPVQYTVPQPVPVGSPQSSNPQSINPQLPTPPPPPGELRIRVFARGDVQMQAQWQQDPRTNQAIAVINQGVTMFIEGLTARKGSIPGMGAGPTTLDLQTDRLVLWTTAKQQQPDLNNREPLSQGENDPLEVYMEGHVEFRQGDHIIYADRMYYDVRNHVATILDADMLTPAPGYEGKVRLHADVVQQTGEDHFRAQDVFVTSSRLGIPRYRLQMQTAEFDNIETPQVDPITGEPLRDPKTKDPLVTHQELVAAQNNLLYIEDIPIFYWPTFATDLNDPSFLIRRIQAKEDGVFGAQLYLDLAAYQLLGIKNRPTGTDWTLSFNYLSDRGFSEATEFTYDRSDILGIKGQTSGKFTFWGISDRGTDNLGQDRTSVQPEPDVPYRYEAIYKHRQDLGEGFTFTAEFGKISDRNFLLEYFKQDWDEQKDPTTDLELKWRRDNWSMSLMGEARLDNFVTETQWLPRFDHDLLGESLVDDKLTWFEHTSVGYAQFKVGTLPNAAAGDEAVSHLPWEPQNFSGGRFVSRNEIDLPVELGPVKIVPYLLGELGYWGEDLAGNDLTRAYYQAGIRATLPMWAVDCEAQSELWNVHGLAHKVEFQAEYFHAQSDQSMTQFPLYDPLDDEQTEDFRRRFTVNTFGFPAVAPPATQGPPTKFDERYYALRNDMEGWVTAPSMEIADNLDEVKLGIHQRWQTKRGPEDNPHIMDWIEFDTDITLFPDASRDNFGTDAGLADYNFIWHVGDRLTVLSDGIFDFFGQGQKIITTGVYLTRPPRGALYVGFRILDGPISSDVLAMSYSYWMSPKWITTGSMSIDLKDTKNFGPTFQIIRVGESMLIGMNINYNPALNTAGIGLTVEPRFVPKSGKLSQTSGVHVGQAGEFGVE